MAYQVYLVDSTGAYAELDCEGVNFATIFSIADVTDISKRFDKITKTISFKGTKVNNAAFGSCFHHNTVSDFTYSNKLFFNFNAQRPVDCMIYEDSQLILEGTLTLTNIDINGGEVTYETFVSGSFNGLMNILSEKTLSDLDVEDLKHEWSWDNVVDSWEVRTQVYNATNDTFQYQPFVKGKRYVYPFIDHGVLFQDTDINNDVSKVHFANFKPAIFVREYFDRIFSQDELSGFSYEIRGDVSFIDKFNSLIVPNYSEKIVVTNTADDKLFLKDTSSQEGFNGYLYLLGQQMTRPLEMAIDESTGIGEDILESYGAVRTVLSDAVKLVNRTFTATGEVRVTIQSLINRFAVPIKVRVQLVERGFIESSNDDEFDTSESWNVVAESGQVTIGSNQQIDVNKEFVFVTGEHTYNQNSQIMVRLLFDCSEPYFNSLAYLAGNTFTPFTVSNVQLLFPKSGPISFDALEGDVIIPQPVPNIKQMDFIRSIIKIFNFYVYTEKENPKRLIFQRYSDYYAFTRIDLLPTSADDWTYKIDYSKKSRIKTNRDIPKKYLFTWKEDSDTLNSTYKKNWNEVYGTFRFNDTYGIGDEKKVEVIFSPSPLMSWAGSGRVHPGIFTGESSERKPTKANIRLMYYNGVKSCKPYSVMVDSVGEISTITLEANVIKYAQCGNYYLDSGLNNMKPIEDLYYGLAKELYFDKTPQHETCGTAYNYYIQQTTELTDPNVRFIECEAYLNQMDITNLDLRTPVFIDYGSDGNMYYKVMEVEYSRNDSTASVKLQSIP